MDYEAQAANSAKSSATGFGLALAAGTALGGSACSKVPCMFDGKVCLWTGVPC
jgi:hypothetical protein